MNHKVKASMESIGYIWDDNNQQWDTVMPDKEQAKPERSLHIRVWEIVYNTAVKAGEDSADMRLSTVFKGDVDKATEKIEALIASEREQSWAEAFRLGWVAAGENDDPVQIASAFYGIAQLTPTEGDK